jgi:diguanylate cyclase (GGDEF)-like protein
LKKELDESLRSDQPMCLILIDIDDFKQVNDTHGHLMGDNVLKHIGELINQSVREMDLAARYGGEELVIVMPKIELPEAKKVVQRIRQDIARLRVDQLSVTVSVGVAQSGEKTINSEQLISSADQALYTAKRQGKNQVVATVCQ